MKIEELKEQLQENLITILSDELDSSQLDVICEIVVSTINNNFYALENV